MRQCLLFAGCVCLLAWAVEAADGQPSFELHEWGVFGVYPNVEYANADMKAEWESLPKFMYGFVKGKKLPYHGPVEKPIVYIHTKDAFALSMTVKFPEGTPIVWYPAAANIVDDGWHKIITADRLEWNLGVNQLPGNPKDAQQPPEDVFKGIEKPKDAQQTPWFELARKPEAAQVFAAGGWSQGMRRQPEALLQVSTEAGWSHVSWRGCDVEKFVYYDGLVPAPQHIKFSALQKDMDALRIENSAAFEIPAFFIIDRAHKEHVRFGALNNAKGKDFAVPMREIKPADWPAEAEKSIAAAMMAAGLDKAEAESAVAIWRKGFFEGEGVTLLWLLPQAEYDQLLPLELKPPADKIVRAGLVYQPHADGAEARIQELLKQLVDENFDKREEAGKALAAIGGIALPYLREAAKSSKSAEAVTRCKQILDTIDAESYLKKSPPGAEPQPKQRPTPTDEF